jgi:hypothetical protein
MLLLKYENATYHASCGALSYSSRTLLSQLPRTAEADEATARGQLSDLLDSSTLSAASCKMYKSMQVSHQCPRVFYKHHVAPISISDPG